jgi:hypothetical protein
LKNSGKRMPKIDAGRVVLVTMRDTHGRPMSSFCSGSGWCDAVISCDCRAHTEQRRAAGIAVDGLFILEF